LIDKRSNINSPIPSSDRKSQTSNTLSNSKAACIAQQYREKKIGYKHNSNLNLKKTTTVNKNKDEYIEVFDIKGDNFNSKSVDAHTPTKNQI
jgi:hypothetical protein